MGFYGSRIRFAIIVLLIVPLVGLVTGCDDLVGDPLDDTDESPRTPYDDGGGSDTGNDSTPTDDEETSDDDGDSSGESTTSSGILDGFYGESGTFYVSGDRGGAIHFYTTGGAVYYYWNGGGRLGYRSVGENYIYRDSTGYLIISYDEVNNIIYFHGSNPSTFASVTGGDDAIFGELE
jgi:hypothetical protein